MQDEGSPTLGLVLPDAIEIEIVQKPDNAHALVLHPLREGRRYFPPIALGLDLKLAGDFLLALAQSVSIAEARNAKLGIPPRQAN